MNSNETRWSKTKQYSGISSSLFIDLIQFYILITVSNNTMATASQNDTRRKTLVLLGRKGDGKSASGNTMLGRPCFSTDFRASNVLTPCAKETTLDLPNFTEVNVIDTPGMLNTDIPDADVEKELSRVFDLASVEGGIDAFLIVLRAERFTTELRNTIKYVRELFGPDVMKYAVLVFAGLDNLEFDGVTFEEFIQNMPKELAEDMTELKMGFNNRSASDEQKQQQVTRLLSLVSQLRNKTKYTVDNVPSESPMHRWVRHSSNGPTPTTEPSSNKLQKVVHDPIRSYTKKIGKAYHDSRVLHHLT